MCHFGCGLFARYSMYQKPPDLKTTPSFGGGFEPRGKFSPEYNCGSVSHSYSVAQDHRTAVETELSLSTDIINADQLQLFVEVK